MRHFTILASFVAGVVSFAALGCGTTKPPPAAQAPQAPQAPNAAPSQSPAPANPATPANEATPVAAPSAAPVGKESPKAAPGKSAVEPSKPSATPPSPPAAKEPTPTPVAAPSKPPAAPAAVEPNKIAAAPAASAHAKVGSEKCMMCHRIQYTSWSESKHKAKGLDCEGCHGNGADYKAISVMKDRAAAVKAGLIRPGLVFCKKCHVKAEASMLPLVHAHKAK